jgi:hypothetical protein
MPHPHRFAAVALAAVLALSGSGCNGGGPEASPTTVAAEPATTGPTTTVKTVPQSELLDTMAPLVVNRQWFDPELAPMFEDFVRAEQSVLKAGIAPVDPDDPEVAARHSGEMLGLTKRSLTGLRDKDRSLGVPTKFILEPRHLAARNDTAVQFYSCYFIEQPMIETSTGKVVATSRAEELKAFTMELVNNRWLMTLRSQKDEWKGKSCVDALLTVSSS